MLVNIVCDNHPVNHAMLAALGVILRFGQMKPTLRFENIEGNEIVAILDPPHLIKLTWNVLGDYKVLVNGDGNLIQWKYVTLLHELQTKEGFHLANLGGLIRPSLEVVGVARIANSCLDFAAQILYTDRSIYQRLSLKTVTLVAERKPALFSILDNHGHKLKMLKK